MLNSVCSSTDSRLKFVCSGGGFKNYCSRGVLPRQRNRVLAPEHSSKYIGLVPLSPHMATWLSVGKSFKGTGKSSENDLQVQVVPINDFSSKHVPDQDSKVTGTHKREKKDKKEKKGRKDKKEKKSRNVSKKRKGGYSELQVWERSFNAAEQPDFSSDSFSSDSSDEDTNAKRRRLLHDADIVSGAMQLTYLPNGEAILVPRRGSDQQIDGNDWHVDRRADRDMLLYEGMHPREIVEYTVHLTAQVVNDDSGKYYRPISHNSSAAVASSSQLYRRSTQRPSGLMVSALKQHRDYENATKTARIFMHRQQLLSERNQELRLHQRHRYFSATARNILEEPSLRRLDMRYKAGGSGQSSSSGGISGSTVVLPLPYVDTVVVSELGFGPQKAGKLAAPNTTAEGENGGFATPASKAQAAANELQRTVNQQLRERPHDLQVILHAVSAQDTICIQQRIASGRPYSSLRNSPYGTSKNKADVVLRKTISERKVAILEQALRENRGDMHICSVLRDKLVCELQRTGQQTEAVDRLYHEAVHDTPLNIQLQLARWVNNLGVFSRSDYKSLTSGLDAIHSETSRAAYNLLAARELSQLVDASVGAVRDVSKVQQQYSRAGLEADLRALRCDLLGLQLLVELRTGHAERAVAAVQVLPSFGTVLTAHFRCA
jgi:hypothetical protein